MRATDIPLQKPIEKLLRDNGAQVRRVLDQTGNVCKVLLALAGGASWIQRCPDLALQDILDRSNGQALTQDVLCRRTIEEWDVSRVELNLDPQITVGAGDVQAVRKLLEFEPAREHGPDALEIVDRQYYIEIQADDGVHVRVYALTANDTEPDLLIAKESQKLIEQSRSIHGYGLPEGAAMHQRPTARS